MFGQDYTEESYTAAWIESQMESYRRLYQAYSSLNIAQAQLKLHNKIDIAYNDSYIKSEADFHSCNLVGSDEKHDLALIQLADGKTPQGRYVFPVSDTDPLEDYSIWEQAMKTNAGLKAATVQYAKTRPVFEQYKATKYSRKFLAEHEADIELYRAAQAEMRRLLGGAKLPKMDALKEESRKLTAKKKRLYGEYQKARRDMQEIVTIKVNIDTLLGYTEPGRKQEKER